MKVVPKRDPPTALKHLRETAGSDGYSLIAQRYELMLRKKVQAIESDLGQEETWKARGFIQAMRTAIEVPSILERELRQSASQKPQ